MKRLIPMGLALTACGAEAPLPSRTVVTQKFALARESEPGVSPGFDLDRVASTILDSRSCGKEDFVDAAGAKGIDNQLARLLPLVDLAGQGAVDALVQAAIREGRLLMLTTLEPVDETHATLRFLRGKGAPLLGTDGELLSGQTFALDDEPLLGETSATLEGGAWTVEPFPIKLPIVIFGILYLLDLPDARMRFVETPEGDWSEGVLGGAVPVEQLLGFAKQAGDSSGNDFVSDFGDGIREAADMDRDAQSGLCTRMSLAATFGAVPAFEE